MRLYWTILGVLAGSSLNPALIVAQSGFTGTLLIRTTVHARQDTMTQRTKGRRTRFDYLCDLVRSCTMIVDGDAHVAWIVEHDRKVYLTITQADDKQLEAMQLTLGAMLEAKAGSDLWDFRGLKFAKTGKSEELAGLRCEVWIGRGAGDDESEACLGTGGVGIALELLADPVAESTSVTGYTETGLPRDRLRSGLLRIRLVKNGRPSTIEVIRVARAAVNDTLFAPPVGYTEVLAADIIKRMQASLEQAERRGLSLNPRAGPLVNYPMADDPRLSRPPSLISCAWDALPPGAYRGEAQVTYRVTPLGVPDTATVIVERLNGADLGTYRVAAQRTVAVCRFTPVTGDSNSGGTLMRQRISFGGAEEDLEEASDSEVVIPAWASPSDLESVTMVSCQPVLHEEGRIRVRMIVGTDGLPEPGTIHAINETTQKRVEEAPAALAHCVFTPARYKGIPIRQKIEFMMTVRLH